MLNSLSDLHDRTTVNHYGQQTVLNQPAKLPYTGFCIKGEKLNNKKVGNNNYSTFQVYSYYLCTL